MQRELSDLVVVSATATVFFTNALTNGFGVFPRLVFIDNSVAFTATYGQSHRQAHKKDRGEDGCSDAGS